MMGSFTKGAAVLAFGASVLTSSPVGAFKKQLEAIDAPRALDSRAVAPLPPRSRYEISHHPYGESDESLSGKLKKAFKDMDTTTGVLLGVSMMYCGYALTLLGKRREQNEGMAHGVRSDQAPRKPAP